MDEEKQQATEVTRFVEKDFLISENNSLIPSTDIVSLEEFRKYLTEKLKFLLDE